jgi:hypothetical protein
MGLEIERKFLLRGLPPKYLHLRVDDIKQAYLLEGMVKGTLVIKNYTLCSINYVNNPA